MLAGFDRLVGDGASAGRVHRFFAGLDPDAVAVLATRRRDVVGELDGAPWRLRVEVNRERLLAGRNAIRSAYDPQGNPEEPLGPQALARMSDADRTRLNTLNRMLAPNVVTSHDFQGRPVKTEVPRQFLSLATDGDGAMAEVLGDLSTARYVVFVVHGIGVTLDDPTQVDIARAIHDEVGPDETATINVVYDAPNGLGGAIAKEHAYQLAERLPELIAGVQTQIRPDALTSMTTHSFGTIAGAETVRNRRAFVHHVDFRGSPGLGHDIDSVADLDADERIRFTAARAPGDAVSISQWHGKDPADFPDIQRLATSAPGGPSVTGHEQFWRHGSESLVNLGRLCRGEYDDLTTTDTTVAEETRLPLGLSWGGTARAVSTPVGKWLAPALGDRPAVSPAPAARPANRDKARGPLGPSRAE